MDLIKKIKMLCACQGVSQAELAKRIGTSPQNLNQRLKVGKFTQKELEEIGRALNAEYYFGFRLGDGTEV